MKNAPQWAGRLARWSCLGLLLGATSALEAVTPITIPYQLTHALHYGASPSPDGKRLATITALNGKGQLFIMNADGSGALQVTHDEADYDDPAWSPDGRWIALTSLTAKDERIVIVHPDGDGLEPLSPVSVRAIHPSWSADSTRILYCTDDDLAPPRKNDSDIVSIDIATRQSRVLITGGVNTYPVLSPDSTRIAFRRMIGEMNSEVFVADADGTNAHNITNHPAFDGWPAWSPDGKSIAFASNRASSYQIYTMDPTGGNVKLVANTEGRATAPTWAPDGKTLYFTVCRKVDFGSDCEVLVARLDHPAK